MTDMERDELIEYITPVDLSLLAQPDSENYARYCRELPTGVAADCVREGRCAVNSNREEVRHLRLSGLGSKAIANQTGIPQEQVEIYCHQLGLPIEGSCRLCIDVREPDITLKCIYCGGPLTGRRQKFCCNHCKDAYIYQQRKRKRGASDG